MISQFQQHGQGSESESIGAGAELSSTVSHGAPTALSLPVDCYQKRASSSRAHVGNLEPCSLGVPQTRSFQVAWDAELGPAPDLLRNNGHSDTTVLAVCVCASWKRCHLTPAALRGRARLGGLPLETTGHGLPGRAQGQSPARLQDLAAVLQSLRFHGF